MFKFLRKNRKTILWIIVISFGIGIFSFGFISRTVNIDIVATVNGKKISYQTFKSLVSQQLFNWQNQNKDKEITQKDITQIKKEVLRYLIQQQLLLNEAQRLGIQTSKAEVISTIQSLPQFQKDGKFLPQLYFQNLSRFYHLEPPEYEKIVENNLIVNRLRRFILSNIRVTEKEIEEEYLLNSKKINKEEIKKKLLQNKRTLYFTEWLKSLYKDTKIKNYLPRIEKTIKQ